MQKIIIHKMPNAHIRIGSQMPSKFSSEWCVRCYRECPRFLALAHSRWINWIGAVQASALARMQAPTHTHLSPDISSSATKLFSHHSVYMLINKRTKMSFVCSLSAFWPELTIHCALCQHQANTVSHAVLRYNGFTGRVCNLRSASVILMHN